MAQEIELNFEMDPVERLTKEVDASNDAVEKQLGAFLLEQFKKDEPLKEAYRTRKCTLKAISAHVFSEARNYAKGSSSAAVEDKIVYGWVIHFVQDGKIEKPKKESYVLTKEEEKDLKEKAKEEYLAEQKRKIAEAEAKKAEREAKAKERALKKEKQKQEESGQLSLFDI